MSGRHQQDQEGKAAHARRLESWKEIAAYLRRGVRTVRRWEKEEGLPVHRQMHRQLGTVYAYTSELDTWRDSRGRAADTARRARHAMPARMRLAVLPFRNLTGDPDQEFVADGLTDELIGELGRINPESLGIIARTTVMQYKGATRTVQEIGEALNVQYVVEGSVRREGDRVRVTAQVVTAKDQSHAWSGTREQADASLLALQRGLAGDISREIGLIL